MNLHHRTFRSNMTSKCQVTIPKEIRDALGLKAGDRVGFELDDDGNARIIPADREETLSARRERIAQGVREARRLFKAENCLPEGMTADEWFELMRGPPAEV